ncbi:MAG TPA: DNA recombination protein RmuC [Terriglobia bacterium]|nr:DNA recombination protein RmuC [Terriglobia bacterium]
MDTGLVLLIGLAVGAALGWAWANWKAGDRRAQAEARASAMESAAQELRGQVESHRKSLDELQGKIKQEAELRAAAEARLEEARRKGEEERALLEEARQRLSDAFKALASEALKSNNAAFIELAKSNFETIQAEAKGDLETRQKAIEGVVGPLREAVDRYEREILEMEKARQNAYGTLGEQLRTLGEVNQKLQAETTHLANALSTPLKVRGRWGELTLRRVAELAGMSEHCDFVEQETIASESGRQRPDMIVRLPGNRRIAVDAKVPLQAFLEAVDPEKSDEERESALARHGKLVHNHLSQLAERRYWDQVGPELELVVLFLPGESFFSAALEQDSDLIEDGMKKHVVLATPTTLIALLHAVAYGWRQEQIARNAQAISALGKDLYDRIKTFVGHFEGVGGSLHRAIENYNKAVGSLESRVLTAARKFKQLGAATGDEIPELEPVDEAPRALSAPAREDDA